MTCWHFWICSAFRKCFWTFPQIYCFSGFLLNLLTFLDLREEFPFTDSSFVTQFAHINWQKLFISSPIETILRKQTVLMATDMRGVWERYSSKRQSSVVYFWGVLQISDDVTSAGSAHRFIRFLFVSRWCEKPTTFNLFFDLQIWCIFISPCQLCFHCATFPKFFASKDGYRSAWRPSLLKSFFFALFCWRKKLLLLGNIRAREEE